MFIPNMGNISDVLPSSASSRFSPVQQRLLLLLFGQPVRRFQGGELIRLVDSGTGATHRQLQQMLVASLLVVHNVGNQKFYQANHDSPIFAELMGIVRKTFGLAQPLRDAIEALASHVSKAFVFGSIASGTERAPSDVDVMIISDDLDYTTILEALQPVEGMLARTINPTVMTRADWQRKRTDPESFVSRVANAPRLWIIGDRDAAP
jgi:predicted nucleotidyltransferase